jgi:hypothetical protein
MKFTEIAKEIAQALINISERWDGKSAIVEMKNAGYSHWKQMEWMGFYFQFLCEKNLKNIIKIPGPRYGNVGFDGFKTCPWDFKAHAMNTSSHTIIVNDSEAVANGIKDYGCIGLILALGQVVYNDKNRTFQRWHDAFKGEASKYVRERIKRGAWSRLRKVSFDLEQISFIQITDETLIKSGSFQSGFRNADGSPRRPKLSINLEKIESELKYFINF